MSRNMWSPGLRPAGLLLLLIVGLGPIGCGGDGADEIVCDRDGTTLEDGLKITDVRCGSGTVAESGMSATVTYEASLASGEAISIGSGTGEPYTFRIGVGQVVPAWDLGLVGMAVGGVRRLEAPPELAYGEAGLLPDVPPDAAVTFEVELLELKTPD